MDSTTLVVISGFFVNIVVVAFGYGMLWQKVDALCKTLDGHIKNHPNSCIAHLQVESDIAVLKSKLEGKV